MIQTTINGLLVGANYALLAVGYTLVFGIMRLLTLAHGEIFMASGLLTVIVATRVDIPIGVAVLLAVVIGAALSALTDIVSFRPVGYPEPIAAAVSTIGLGLIIGKGLVQIRDSDTAVTLPEAFGGVGDWMLGPLVISPIQTASLWTAGVVMVLTLLFMRRSRWGLAMRAFASDPEAVSLLGVPVRRLTLLTLAIAGGLAGLASMLHALRIGSASTGTGLTLGLIGLAVMTVGGLGSLPGAMVAGIGLGVFEAFVDKAGWAGVQEATPWVLLVVVLLTRPQGLFGEAPGD